MKRIKLANRVGRLGCTLAAALIAAAWVSSGASAQTLNTLVTFSGGNGSNPQDRGGLIADAHGNLFGTTSGVGSAGYGTVFEIKTDSTTATGYAGTPTTLVSFNSTDGSYPFAGLMADAHGNLFGTTSQGGAYGSGTVFEIRIDSTTATGYATTPTTLVNFNSNNGGDQYAGVIADASGNLFGTALFPGAGTVFEIKTDSTTATGYATTPTNLVIFNYANGQYPFAGLIADAGGNLFGTTYYGGGSVACSGSNGCGTVFEIKVDSTTATGYAGTPTTLVSFNGADGAYSESVLIVDTHGNLFGTTSGLSLNTGSGPSSIGFGTVFELKVDSTTATGYAGTPTTLVSFNGADPYPFGGLIADTHGNLFGTTSGLSTTGLFGTVFEVKTDSTTATGYAGTPTTLVSFNGADGAYPIQTLIADAYGNLFGTAEGGGGATGYGTVFEVTGSGFVPPTVLQSITVSSSMTSVAAGLTLQFSATGHYSDGSTQDLTSSVTWSSSNTGIVTISSGGLATGVSAGGPVTIMASLNSIIGTVQLTVTAPLLVSIAVTPANPSVPATTTQQFTATGTYTDGSMKSLTGAVTWSSSNMSVTTINASSGLASALSAGTSMISAALGGVSGSTTITVITARVQVTKTFNGSAIPSGDSFTFQLRSGASSTAAGTVLESETFTSSTAGGTILFTSLLIPGQQYETCEQMLPGWLTTLGQPLYPVFNPSGDNSVVCTNFTPAVNQTVQFTIDNHPPPGGMALGIGFWKNWASCANNHGNQTPVLDRVLASFPVASGQTTPGVYVGNLYVNSCVIAEDLLNKMTLNGTKEASDPLYSLAAQLLAAKLNVQAGAGWTACVSMDISSAGNLLNPVKDAAGNTGVDFANAFNGNTAPKLTSSQATTANYLQTQINYYNNNQPVQCPPGYAY